MAPAPMNLIPEGVHQARTGRRHLKRWTVAAVLALTLLAIPAGVDWYSRVRADELNIKARRLAGQLSSMRKQVEGATDAANEAFLQLERANALRAKRSWSSMLAMLGVCMPTECWLISIATDPAVPSGAARVSVVNKARKDDQPEEVVTIDAPRKLRLIGYALNDAQPMEFVTRLKDAQVFQRVTLERSLLETSEEAPRFRFELVCEW